MSLLHRLFEDRVGKSSQQPAIEFRHTVTTYESLNNDANRLARHLRHFHGVESGTVALCLDKSPLMVTAVLAVLKAGLAWLPLPVDAPPLRIQQIVDIARPALVLASADTARVTKNLSTVECLDDVAIRARLQEQPGHDLSAADVNIDASALCHVLFTSGSTGVPKGVLIEHQAISHNACLLASRFGLDQNTRTLQFAAYTFDIFGLDLFMTFSVGGCLVMDSTPNMMNDMTAFVNQKRITYTQLTPTVISMMNPTNIQTLSVLASSGEPLTSKIVQEWRHRVRLINAYGPTETIVCTIQDMSVTHEVEPRFIGTALEGLEVILVQDSSAEEVPPGETGEICVAGVQIFRGYLGLDPSQCGFFYRDTRKFYRTGDLGVLVRLSDSEATIRCVGRKDNQVKMHGVRVDLGDVETAIRVHPATGDCMTTIPRHGLLSSRLVAVISVNDRESWEMTPTLISNMDLLWPNISAQKHLRGRMILNVQTILPPQAIPSVWFFVTRLPLTISGKIDRIRVQNWLQELDESQYAAYVTSWAFDSEENDVPPKITSIQQQLVDICSEILALDSTVIDPRTSFLQLGLDSLATIRLASSARGRGIELSVQQALQAESIEQLSLSLSTHEFKSCAGGMPRTDMVSQPLQDFELHASAISAAEQCDIDPNDIVDIYPCSSLQAGMMALSVRRTDSHICLMSFLLATTTDVDRMQEATDTLIARIAVLRNRIVHDPVTGDFLQVTVRHRKAYRNRESFDSPMSFGDNLCRCRLDWDHDTKRWRFKFKIHHALFDDWSRALIVQELKKIYDTGSCSDAGHTFRDYIGFLRNDQKLRSSDHSSFWQTYLAGSVASNFPNVADDWVGESMAHQNLERCMEVDLASAARRFRVTTATIVQFAWAIAIGRATHSDDVTFGITLSGRDISVKDIDRIIGPTMVTNPYRVRWSASSKLDQLLQSSYQQSVTAIPHRIYGLQNIMTAGDGAKAACRFRSLVIVQTSSSDQDKLPDLFVTEEQSTRSNSEMLQTYPLAIELFPEHGKIMAFVHVDTRAVSELDLTWILDTFESVLKQIESANHDILIADIATSDPPISKDSDKFKSADTVTPIIADSKEVVHDSSSQLKTRRKLNDAWKEIFGVSEDFGHEENFFRVGGDSFLAIKLVLACKKQGLYLSVTDMYKNPTLQQMAAILAMAPNQERNSRRVGCPTAFSLLKTASEPLISEIARVCGIDDEDIEDVYQASPFQEGLFAVSMRSETAYMARLTYALPRDSSQEDLTKAVEVVIARNPIMRTTIAQTSSGTMQVVLRYHQSLAGNSEWQQDTSRTQDSQGRLKEGKKLFNYHIGSGNNGEPLLQINIHHLIYDEWVLHFIVDDVKYNYDHVGQERKGRPTYSNFIEYLANSSVEKSARFWKDNLRYAGVLDFPRLASTSNMPQTDSVARLSRGAVLSRAGDAFISPATMAAAAWGLLLSCYGNTDDVVFGITLSGRDVSGLEEIAGPTISTIPFRLKVDGDEKLASYVSKIQADLRVMTEFQHFGLQEISRLDTPGLKDACKFRTLLVVQQDHVTFGQDHGLTLEAIKEQTFMSLNYALVIILTIEQATGDLRAHLEYDSTITTEKQAHAILGQFYHIFNNLCSNGDTLSSVDRTPKDDLDQVLRMNQRWLSPPQANRCLHHVVEQQAKKQPDRPAIDSQDPSGCLTYRQLDESANAVAHYLVTYCPSSRFVLIYFGKSELPIVAMLAALKAGRTYVPMNPSLPLSHLKNVLEDLGPDVAVLTESLSSHLFVDFNCLAMDSALSTDLKPLSSAPELEVDPQETCYVLYTSGTTGKPKGVLVSHMSVVTGLSSHIEVVNLTSESRVFQFASFTFDVSVFEIFGSLIAGACICMISDDDRNSGQLVHSINQLQPDVLSFTPSVAQILSLDELSSVRTIVLSGEPLSRSTITACAKNGIRLINGYGPTEATIFATMDPDVTPASHGTIGHPIACSLWIVDIMNGERLAPIGSIGEIVICGPTVSRGYLNNPGATQKSFGRGLPWLSPQDPKDQDFLPYYRTGDLGQYRSDGSILYIGRKDTQVKINGQRVEIGEIESTLRECSAFGTVVVELLSDNNLVAFVQLEATSTEPDQILLPRDTIPENEVDDAVQRLRSRLPTYKVPSIFVPIKRIPMTSASRKIDRKLLRSIIHERIEEYRHTRQRTKKSVSTNAQKGMIDIWSAVLGSSPDEIQAEDVFQELGGDSVGLIRLLSAVRKKGFKISTTQIDLSMTLGEMSQILEESEPESSIHETVLPYSLIAESEREQYKSDAAIKCHVQLSKIMDVYPCTPLQEGLMALSLKEPGSYMTQRSFEISRNFEQEEIWSAIQQVWQDEAILRSRIFFGPQLQSLQAVINEDRLPFKTAKCSLEEYLQKDRQVQFQYGKPLSRFSVVEEPTGKEYLIITQHHAVCDGWSTNLLLNALTNSLTKSAETPSQMTNRIPSFVKSVGHVQTSHDAMNFWKSSLAGSVSAKFLSQKESVFQATEWHKHTFEIPHTTKTALSVILESAWALTIGRYTDSEDVCFGVVRSGRTVPVLDVESMMFPTIVTIPRRLKPQASMTVSQYLEETRSKIAQATSFEQFGLQNISRLSEDAKRACEFQTLLTIQPEENSQSDSARHLLRPVDIESMVSTYCLSVDCQPCLDRTITISINYDNSVVSQATCQWVSYHFSQAVTNLANQADKLLRDIDIAGPKDTEQVITWNKSPVLARNQRVETVFEERIDQYSDLTAIDAHDRSLSYAQLHATSDLVAHSLLRLGVGPGDLIPLCFEKSAIMIVALLGILKAGAGYVPLAVDNPVSRLNIILDHVSAKVVLCSPEQENLCRSLKSESLLVINAELLSQSKKGKIGEIQANATHPAYVMYTSGSTGTPKGVQLSHVAVTTTILEQARLLNFVPGTRTLQFCSYTFDCSVTEIFMTLLHGGCLCIPSEEQRLTSLVEFINRKDIDLAVLTATVVSSVLQAPSNVPRLKTLMLVGEAMTQAIVEVWSKKLCLINDYGPTEACIDALINTHVTPDTLPGNIGFPIATSTWVVDRHDPSRLAPIGCPGELLISGPTLADGYLKDKDRTDAAFLDASQYVWTKTDDSRLYRTGDLVYQNSDGSIVFIARKDTQVKLHGLRVELGEIEFHLSRCNSVSAAIVDVVDDKLNDDSKLIAFVVLKGHEDERAQSIVSSSGTQQTIQDALMTLSAHVPRYMVPQLVLPLSSIPVTTSGKTDRLTLKQLYRSVPQNQLITTTGASRSRRPPESKTQRQLRDLWADILHIDADKIGLDDSFFLLGGDSIGVIRLSSHVKEHGYVLSAKSAFRNPTLEAMAECTRNDHRTFSQTPVDDTTTTNTEREHVSEAYGISQDEILDIYPCTSLQAGLMSLSMRLPQAYIATEIFRIPDSVDLKKFTDALNAVHQSHELLRTRICQVDDDDGMTKLVQVVCASRFALPNVESAEVPVVEEYEIGLGTPLAWFTLVKTPDGHYLQMTRHHSIYDGWSSRLFLNDLTYAYKKETSPLSRPPFRSYIDHLQNVDQTEAEQYWEKELAGFQAEHYPRPRLAKSTPKARSPSSLTTSFSCTSSAGINFASLARAAWALIVSAVNRVPSEVHDVCFGGVVSGRMVPLQGIEDIAGPTVNTVPIRLRLDLQESINQYLRRVRDHAVDMTSFEHLGLTQIRNVSESARIACDFKNLLVVQPPETEGGSEVDEICRRVDSGRMTQSFGLVVECQQSPDREKLQLDALFDEDMLSEGEVRAILRHFSRAIQLLHDRQNSDMLIGSVFPDLTTEQDYQQMLQANGQPLPRHGLCLHQLIEQNVERFPDRIAVLAHDQELTYRQLDDKCHRLALHLQKLGVGPDVLVPICLEKSSYMIIAMVAILKAGGGYVPLDPTYPEARLRSSIQQTKAELVLVSADQSERFRGMGFATVTVDSESLARLPLPGQLRAPTPENIAYVIFTSGTTGTPKGVMMEHGSISLAVIEYAKAFDFEPGRPFRTLQCCVCAFDVSVVEIFCTLTSGGTICVPKESDLMTDLVGLLTQWKINALWMTPTMASVIDPNDVPDLRMLAVAGERIPSTLVQRWTSKDVATDMRFYLSYGPTETTPLCSAHRATPRSAAWTVGVPFGGRMWIADVTDSRRLSPVGCVGEIVISDGLLARGYLNDAEKTANCFIHDTPWLQESQSQRIYKTGDLGRYTGDGNFECLGRKDNRQVKINGIRIETGEIESTLNSLGIGFSNVAVEKVEIANQAPLVVFFQCHLTKTDCSDARQTLAASMSRELADFVDTSKKGLSTLLPKRVIPSLFLPVLRWPRTSNGKTDRRVLREEASKLTFAAANSYRRGAQPEDRPRTKRTNGAHDSDVSNANNSKALLSNDARPVDARQSVLELWRRVLRKRSGFTFDEQDSFFGVGGDSLSAMALVAEFRKLGIHTTVGELHENDTLVKMFDIMRRQVSKRSDPDLNPFSLINVKGRQLQALTKSLAGSLGVTPSAIEDVYPCTPLQAGTMYLSDKVKGSYHGSFDIQIPADMNPDKFFLAWKRLLELHSVLRTRIVFDKQLGHLQVVLHTDDHVKVMQQSEHGTRKHFGYALPLYRYRMKARSDRVYLKLEIHHSLYDGWSLPLLLDDLRQLYSDPLFSPHCVPFKNFISFISDPSALAPQERFWSNTLKNATVSDFPELSGNMGHVINATSYQEYSMPPILKGISDDITVATVFKAAWALVVSKYTGSDDVCFGLLLSGRDAPVAGIEDMRGPTINTVPLRVQIDQAMSTEDFMRTVQAHLVEMLPHQVRSLTAIRKSFPDGTRDFGSLLVVQPNDSTAETTNEDFSIQSVDETTAQTERMFGEPYPLFIEIKTDGSGKTLLGVHYDPNVISADRIDLVAYQYEVAVCKLAERNVEPLSRVSILSESDQERIRRWAGPPIKPGEFCVHEMIRQIAATYPDSQAIESSNCSLTYAQLEQKTDTLAYHLLQLDPELGPDSMVPVWMETSPLAVLTLIAILKTGASYVPLDLRLPAERVHFIVSDVKARMMLVSNAKLESSRQLHSKSFLVTEVTDDMTEGSWSVPRVSVGLSDLAYVIYTSGSTGVPKGVMMEHWALSATVRDQAATYEIGLGNRMFGLANLSWDPSLLEIFAPLSHGGCLCIPTEDERNRDLTGAINRLRAEHISTSPAVASLIDLRRTPTVTVMSLGGETIRRENILNAHQAGVRLFNIYGPSEACIDAIVHRNMVLGTRVQNIGTPMSSQAWIVDVRNPYTLVPPGCVGEIALSGTLARGYLNDPVKTAKSFLRDCTYASPVYLTGDLGRFDTDGTIQFLGRKDRQVKVNGQRVELGEIENAIKTARPTQNIVVDYFAVGNTKSLVAFLVGSDDESGGRVEILSQLQTGSQEYQHLQAQLMRTLPRYMVPRIFAHVSRLPLSSADKVDFRALQHAYDGWFKISAEQSVDDRQDLVPLTPAETRLRDLWASVTDRLANSIQKYNNFFDLGADSLTIIKLSTLAASKGIAISITDIYGSPTLTEMAKLLQKTEGAPEEDDDDDEDPLPFSLVTEPVMMQRRKHEDETDLLPCNTVQTTSIIQGLKHGSYFGWFLVQVEGAINEQRLYDACTSLSERHGILRSSFCMIHGNMFQTVHAQAHVDFKCLASCSTPEEFLDRINEDVPHPVSLDKVITKFRMARVSATSHILALGMSHAQYDGFCFNTFYNDLRNLYRGPLEVPPPPSYSRYVRYMLRTSSDTKSASFWKELLQNSAMTYIVPHPEPYVRRLLDSVQIRNLPVFRAGIGKATFAMVMKAAWSILLSSISGTNDTVFGSVMFGRAPQVKGMTEIVGPCMNVVPCRVDLPGEWNVTQLVEHIRQQQLATLQFETTPFEKICEHASWPSSTRFSTIVQHQNIDKAAVTTEEAEEIGVWTYLGEGTSGVLCDDVDCWITTVPLADRTSLQMRYNNSVMPDEIASNVVEVLSNLVTQMYASPNRSLGGLRQLARSTPISISVPPLKQPNGTKRGSKPVLNGALEKQSKLTDTLRDLWARTIAPSGGPHVTTDQDISFFEVGGDSLSATQLASLCEDRGIDLGLQDIFDYPTLNLQSAHVLQGQREGEEIGKRPPRLVYSPDLV